MKIIVLGSTGLLGKNLLKEGRKQNIDIVGFSRSNKKNIFQFSKIKKFLKILEMLNPNIIINAIGEVDIDLCEKRPKHAYNINALLVKYLSTFTKKKKIKLVQISTDHYFLTKKKRKKNLENEKVRIVNNYSKTKFQAEKFTKFNNNHIIIRTNFTGFRKKNKKTFVEWIIHSCLKKKDFNLFDDFFCSTIDVKTLVKIIFELLKTDFKGTINIGSSSVSSKKEFAEKLIKKLGFKIPKINVSSVNSLKTKRASNLGLNVSLIEKVIKKKMPNLNKVINNLCREYKNEF